MAAAVPVHEGLPPHAAGEAVALRGSGDSKRGALPRTERVNDEERGEADDAPLVKPPPLTFRARGWGACRDPTLARSSPSHCGPLVAVPRRRITT